MSQEFKLCHEEEKWGDAKLTADCQWQTSVNDSLATGGCLSHLQEWFEETHCLDGVPSVGLYKRFGSFARCEFNIVKFQAVDGDDLAAGTIRCGDGAYTTAMESYITVLGGPVDLYVQYRHPTLTLILNVHNPNPMCNTGTVLKTQMTKQSRCD